jgi:hypothetical protein
MGPRYKPINLQQDAFVAIAFDKQILPGTFEFALHHLLEHQPAAGDGGAAVRQHPQHEGHESIYAA